MNAPSNHGYTSTLTPEKGALYPKNSTPASDETSENPRIELGYDSIAETPSHSEEIIERHLRVTSPELEEQLQIENGALDAWVAFKVRDHFIQDIYTGVSSQANLTELRDEIILPAYRDEQKKYLKDAGHIVAVEIPTYKTRLQQTKEALPYAEKGLARLQARYASYTFMSAYDKKALQEAKDGVQSKKRDIVYLGQSIENSHLRAQTKEAMFAHLNRFLTSASEDEVSEKVDKVTFVARKSAYQVVIQDLETKRVQFEIQKKEDEAKKTSDRIAALQAELEAYEEVEKFSTGEIETLIPQLEEALPAQEMTTTPEVAAIPEVVPQQVRKFGSWGLSAANVRAVFAK